MKRESLHYSKEHEWVALEGDIATIGITHYAQEQLGEITYLELPEAGDTFEKMARVGTIESVKTVSDLFTPVGGEIVELNPAVMDRIAGEENADFRPENLNKDPYGDGWIMKVKISSAEDMKDLLNYKDYMAMIGEEA